MNGIQKQSTVVYMKVLYRDRHLVDFRFFQHTSHGWHALLQLWSVHQKDNGAPTVTFEAELCYHSKAVNVLRFAASGADPRV